MASRQSNTGPVIIWLIGLFGCIGWINPIGFFALIIPILFWLMGTKLTKDHCRIYFNVLLTAVILWVIGLAINEILLIIDLKLLNFKLIGLIYFTITCIFGLFVALNSKKYRPALIINLFK